MRSTPQALESTDGTVSVLIISDAGGQVLCFSSAESEEVPPAFCAAAGSASSPTMTLIGSSILRFAPVLFSGKIELQTHSNRSNVTS